MENKILSDEPLYTISTVAKILDVSIHTLRLYEREGLIMPQRKESGHRLYSDSDIERLKCIRDAITEKKFSIASIKAMYSLVPCWSIVECTAEERGGCEAYHNYSQPCWTFTHKSNRCRDLDCRDCDIYKKYTQCGNIKDLIQIVSKRL